MGTERGSLSPCLSSAVIPSQHSNNPNILNLHWLQHKQDWAWISPLTEQLVPNTQTSEQEEVSLGEG